MTRKQKIGPYVKHACTGKDGILCQAKVHQREEWSTDMKLVTCRDCLKMLADRERAKGLIRGA